MRLRAILAQRCPVCFQGAMFGGLVTMHEHCPVCGHRFMREPGFFQGAMYVSYTMALVTFATLLLSSLALLQDRIGYWPAAALAFLIQMLLVPLLFRYSRVIWAHVNIGTGL